MMFLFFIRGEKVAVCSFFISAQPERVQKSNHDLSQLAKPVFLEERTKTMSKQ